jgi:hypothetical protein
MSGSYQDQKKNKELDKKYEELEVLGQENEKQAVKDGKKLLKEKERKATKEKEFLLDLIAGASKGSKQKYIFFLGELLKRRMTYVDWKKGWKYEVIPTDVGLILELSYLKRYFRCAFKPSGEALYDLNAINTFGLRAENTMDKIEKESKTLQVEKNGKR